MLARTWAEKKVGAEIAARRGTAPKGNVFEHRRRFTHPRPRPQDPYQPCLRVVTRGDYRCCTVVERKAAGGVESGGYRLDTAAGVESCCVGKLDYQILCARIEGYLGYKCVCGCGGVVVEGKKRVVVCERIL